MLKNKDKAINLSCEHIKAPSLTGYSENYVKLAQYRVVFISEDFTDTLAAELSALLLYFDNMNREEPVEIYIHSNGGAVTGLLNIYDIIQMIQCPVKTVCMGKCYSAGAVLLASGTKGERYAFENSSIMIHGIQAVFPIAGHDLTNSKNYYEFVDSNNDNIMKILAKHTGNSLEKVKNDCKQDLFLDSVGALKYNIIDYIAG